MRAPRLLPLVSIGLLVLGGGLAEAQTEEEAYVRDISASLVEAGTHLDNASSALSECLDHVAECVDGPNPIVVRLEGSRVELIEVRSHVAGIEVPDRYRPVHSLSIDGLTDATTGLWLHVEGLNNGSLTTFHAGFDPFFEGIDDLNEAMEILRATPPAPPVARPDPRLDSIHWIAVSLVLSTSAWIWVAIAVAWRVRWPDREIEERDP